MNIDMQDVVAGLVVFAASAYLARHVWVTYFAHRHGACGGCGGCPSQEVDQSHGFVPLDAVSTGGPKRSGGI